MWLECPNGWHYNNEFSNKDFRGEGFKDGDVYRARIITKNISPVDGSDVDVKYTETKAYTVENGMLDIPIIGMNRFTAVEFIRTEKTPQEIADEKAEEEARIKAEQEAQEKAEEATEEDQADDKEQSSEESTQWAWAGANYNKPSSETTS